MLVADSSPLSVFKINKQWHWQWSFWSSCFWECDCQWTAM